MQPVTVYCRAPVGLDAPEVRVEVFLGPGLPGLHIVGLVETAVKESRDRVRAALQNSGFKMPSQRIVVSLAPADIPKNGSRYDLAIAIGILCASGQVPAHQLTDTELLGELSLSGELRPVAGSLPIAMSTLGNGRRLIIPRACEHEAGLLDNPNILVANHVLEVAGFLNGNTMLPQARVIKRPACTHVPDLSDVEGQAVARRALEIAAVGEHHLLMSGPPGTGKSMLAQRLPGILPQATHTQWLETAAMYSLRGEHAPDWRRRPFRAPHHSATAAALVGGNTLPRPGEISLAHNGVLFLDELPEFSRHTLENLREPLETGVVTIARARQTLRFPARFQLIAAMNPCPCGYAGDSQRDCRCSPDQVRRYQERISGPFLDRIDIRVRLNREQLTLNRSTAQNESSETVRERVAAATAWRDKRNGLPNSQLDTAALQRWCWPEKAGLRLLETAAGRFGLSRRACDRVLRVSRSIADIAGDEKIGRGQVAEALGYRNQTTGPS